MKTRINHKNKRRIIICIIAGGLAISNVLFYTCPQIQRLEVMTVIPVKAESVVEFIYKPATQITSSPKINLRPTVIPTKVPTKIPKQKSTPPVSRGGLDMRATAYDLSVASCGKKPNHPEYGMTRTGTRATVRRTVAVDPITIPLGSKLYIEFPKKYAYLNGSYIAEDTGSAVKKDIVDIFFGEYDKRVDDFGIQKVKVYIIRRGGKK